MRTDWNAVRAWQDTGAQDLPHGEIFPYYVFGQDTPEGLKYGVGGNGIEEQLFPTHDEAYEHAKTLRMTLNVAGGQGK